MHSHPDPQLYTAALAREEHETSGAPLPLSGALSALLAVLALLVILAPRAPRRPEEW